jgi:hypothetical protein
MTNSLAIIASYIINIFVFGATISLGLSILMISLGTRFRHHDDIFGVGLLWNDGLPG